MSDRKVYLHVGAHRTGSSSFQACMDANLERLNAMNFSLAYPSRDGIARGNIKLRMPPLHFGPKKRAEVNAYNQEHLDTLFAKDRHVLLSEENILGKVWAFYKGKFYNEMAANAAFMREALGGHIDHVMIVIRPYTGLYRSCYRKQSEDTIMEDFDIVSKGFVETKRTWTDVIRELVQGTQADNVTVVEMNSRGRSTDLLKRMVPELADQEVAPEPEILNISPTDSAIIALRTRYKRGEELSRSEWQEVIREFADVKDDLGVTKYNPDLERILKDRYARDLENIPKIKGVTFVG